MRYKNYLNVMNKTALAAIISEIINKVYSTKKDISGEGANETTLAVVQRNYKGQVFPNF